MLQKTLIGMILLAGAGTVVATTIWWRQPVAAPTAVYICRETQELFLGRGHISPQIHPDSGRATLSPAIYCYACESWSVAPPAERLSRQPQLLNCPKCNVSRTFDGIVPDDVKVLSD